MSMVIESIGFDELTEKEKDILEKESILDESESAIFIRISHDNKLINIFQSLEFDFFGNTNFNYDWTIPIFFKIYKLGLIDGKKEKLCRV